MLARLKFDITSLVNNLLDQLPSEVWSSSTTTFLDPNMGGGQFVHAIENRLRNAGHLNENIASRVYGYESNRMRINFAVNKYKLVGTYINKDVFQGGNMKFDVVVGNYPYGDSKDSGGTLWGKFANIVFEDLIKDDGYVAAIHPPSFIGKHLNEGTGKSDYTCFRDNQIIELHLLDDFEKEKYFKGVGTKVCWYVAKKQTPAENTKIVGYDKGKNFVFDTNFTTQTFMPQILNELTMSIHKKIISCPAIDFAQKRKLHYHNMKKKNQVSDTETVEYPYKSYFSHIITRYANFKFDDFDAIKVMVPQTSTMEKSFIDKECNVSEDLFYVCCDNMNDANKLLDHLTSPLVKYIGKAYRPGRNLGALLSANIIPTDSCNLNLTQEEIEYIESYN